MKKLIAAPPVADTNTLSNITLIRDFEPRDITRVILKGV